MRNFIKSLKAAFFNSAEKQDRQTQKIESQPPKTTSKIIETPIEDWKNYDKAAQYFFDVLGEPTPLIASNRAYKTWAVEFEISEAQEKIENGEFPPEIAKMFQKMITEFQKALDSGDYNDFTQKSNYFTVGYSFKQFGASSGYQEHVLSIGCPIGGLNAPRFVTSMTKNSYNNVNIAETSGVWIHKLVETDSMIMHWPAPAPYYRIGLEFFNYLEKAYNPESAPDKSQRFAIGGAYGPSGTLG